ATTSTLRQPSSRTSPSALATLPEATTRQIRSTTPDRSKTSTDQHSSGRPPTGEKAFPPPPKRCPDPAPTPPAPPRPAGARSGSPGGSGSPRGSGSAGTGG